MVHEPLSSALSSSVELSVYEIPPTGGLAIVDLHIVALRQTGRQVD